MKAHELIRHTGTAYSSIKLDLAAEVELARGPSLVLRYRLRGDLERVAVATRTESRRADRLWEHTCFEAFVAPAGGKRYVEINVAPSTQWAMYSFDGYRIGMRPLEVPIAPEIDVEQGSGELVVTADVDLSVLADGGWPWHVGLTAVVAEADGNGRTYWALLHPQTTAPDFHDARGFSLRLEGPVR